MGMEGRDGAIQCVGPRIIQAELACYMALLDVTYNYILLFSFFFPFYFFLFFFVLFLFCFVCVLLGGVGVERLHSLRHTYRSELSSSVFFCFFSMKILLYKQGYTNSISVP